MFFTFYTTKYDRKLLSFVTFAKNSYQTLGCIMFLLRASLLPERSVFYDIGHNFLCHKKAASARQVFIPPCKSRSSFSPYGLISCLAPVIFSAISYILETAPT